MISVLFARADSVYKTLGCDVWDEERDARLWPGGNQVIAHPPCRSWGTLSHMSRPKDGERELAFFAVEVVRAYGGVLEHPARSKLWPEYKLPRPGHTDSFGGFTLPVDQHWFGHRAKKATFLYIVGTSPKDLPPIPLRAEKETEYAQTF